MASVHQHRNRWRVKWRDEVGRQLVESFPTEAEARAQARRIEARTVLDGAPPTAVDPDALTVARWWARWEPGRQWADSTRATHTGHYRGYPPVAPSARGPRARAAHHRRGAPYVLDAAAGRSRRRAHRKEPGDR